MAASPYAACIEACNACALACDRCAAACLAEDDPKAMARCISLDVDCAALCRLAAGFMARDSEFAPSVCAVCAELCEACSGECETHDMDHCKACAAACRRCADECQRMAPEGFGAKSREGGAQHAH
jgi:hypothetical protein